MTYLKKINAEFWDFDEALVDYIEKNGGSFDKGLSAFAADLNHYKDTEKGQIWTTNANWRKMIEKFHLKFKEPKEGKESQVPPQVHIAPSNFHDFKYTGSVTNYNYEKSPETVASSKRSNEALSVPISKKSKTNDSTKSKHSVGEKLWSIWEEFLHESSFDDSLFIYSPLRSGVITCGNGIHPRLNMPKSEYYKLLEELKSKDNEAVQFVYKEYIDNILDSETLSEMVIATRILPATKETSEISPEQSRKMLFFLQDIFIAYSRDVYDPRTNLAHSESTYNTMLVYPTMKAMVMASNNQDIRYIPGEEPLNSMTLYLKSTVPQYNDRHCYKADGIIKYSVEPCFEAEIFLLETSNGHGVADPTKKGFDHHKSMFGVLSMLKNVADEYSYCSFETFSTLELYFLHAYKDKMRLWSLSSPSEGIYVLNKKWSITVPIHFDNKDPELLVYLDKIWDLKVKLEQSCRTVMSIKQENKQTLREYRYRYGDYPNSLLLSNIVDPVITKITENEDSKGMGKEFPHSSITP